MPPIIDQHTHPHLNYGHDAKTQAEDVLEAMARAGVEVSIIIDVCGIYRGDDREGNHRAAEAVRSHPGRLIGFASLHPLYAGLEACLSEADRCVKELGFKGLKIHPVTDPTQVGLTHIAFTVKDIQGLTETLTGKGCEFLQSPVQTPSGRRVNYFRAHDGIVIELMQDPPR